MRFLLEYNNLGTMERIPAFGILQLGHNILVNVIPGCYCKVSILQEDSEIGSAQYYRSQHSHLIVDIIEERGAAEGLADDLHDF